MSQGESDDLEALLEAELAAELGAEDELSRWSEAR